MMYGVTDRFSIRSLEFVRRLLFELIKILNLVQKGKEEIR